MGTSRTTRPHINHVGLTPTLPAACSIVFERPLISRIPCNISGFSTLVDHDKHRRTTPNLANGYQDGYQMIINPRALLSNMRSVLSLGQGLATVLDHATGYATYCVSARQRVPDCGGPW